MRNNFTDLIANGVAKFEYTNISGETPNTDPICRMYNNIFSIPTDTHMSCLEDGSRVITGHMINTGKWGDFCKSYMWGAVDFRTSGCWSLCEFLYKHGLKGEISSLNGDVVYKIIPFDPEEKEEQKKLCACPLCCHTLESKIPQPITTITFSNNKLHVVECFNKDIQQVAENLNNSTWIKGTNWVPFNNEIVGLVENKVYILNI